jgi:hypothetical protein
VRRLCARVIAGYLSFFQALRDVCRICKISIASRTR